MDIDTLRAKYTALASVFTERSRRLWAATEARAVNKDERLLTDVEALVEPTASGDPCSPLRWTTKSVRHLEGELTAMGHVVSHRLVVEILHELGYSLQANEKT